MPGEKKRMPKQQNHQVNVDSKGRDKTPRSGLGGPPHAVALGMKGVKAHDFWGSTKRLSRELKGDWLKIIIAVFLALMAVLGSVFIPRVMALAINSLTQSFTDIVQGVAGAGIDTVYITKVLAALLGLTLISALFSYLQLSLIVRVTQGLVYRLRNQVSEKLDRLPLSYFDSQTHGEILSRITIDIDLISSNFQNVLTQLINAVLSVIGITVMMFVMNPILALITLITVPLSMGVTMLLAPHSQKYFAEQQEKLGSINGMVEENYSAHVIVKSFNLERKSVEEFKSLNDSLYESSYRAQFVSSAMMPLVNFVGNLGYVIVVGSAALLSIAGRVLIGDILAFIQYQQQFNQPLMQTAQIANIIQATIAAAERVYSLLDEKEMEAEDLAECAEMERKDTRGHVVGKNIAFSYKQDEPLITDLSFEAKPGQTIAIVGPTGAGKTTIVNLLMRFYEIQGGQIIIDGLNTSEVSRDCLRNNFGMVLQDTWLFNGTIRENIAFGRDDAIEDEIIEAATIALADHFIRTLPEGYDTVLAEDAENISVGQRQLLTIARAVLADAPILILDEATSSVDTRTERLIQKAMMRLMEGRTSFVIAHRLSTIKDADLILVMDKGAVVESGTHEELLKKEGFYAKLYDAQFDEVS